MNKKYHYNWTLSEKTEKHNFKLFSCFSCGGGSSMGYKLAGFEVLGCNEIDHRVMDLYVHNLKPKYSYLEGIKEFKERKDLPRELYDLDILDGSPPCSSFSMAGNRDKDWGVKKKFKEGQVKQVLDTLFFDFIDVAKKLQPKIVVAENVAGLMAGKAKKYARMIYRKFDKAGYICPHFLLDASKMGVPQKRKRVFFICLRKDLIEHLPKKNNLFTSIPLLKMDFNEKEIVFSEVHEKNGKGIKRVCPSYAEVWKQRIVGELGLEDTAKRVLGKEKYFNTSYAIKDRVCRTITTKYSVIILFDKLRVLSKSELLKISSFPRDYDFKDMSPFFVCGMSVPPVMMAHVANQIKIQWLDKLRNSN